MVYYFLHLVFQVYTLLLFVRVMGSWFPSFKGSKWMRFVAHYTDPYLKIFQRIVPPLGGVMDLSPLLGFFALKFLENFLLRLLA
jgi:YggT family protein